MALEPNTTVSHYKILSSVGKGGMGEVYLAEDTRLNRKVAVKFLPDVALGDEERVSRFVQEAHTASALNHPNILTVHEFGEHEGREFIVSEFIEGSDLKELMASGSLDSQTIVDISIQITSALAAAHEAGIIHRDIKPENLMVRSDGILKVLDFGLAKHSHLQPKTSGSEDQTEVLVHTRPGMLIGTARYMSPEQVKGDPLDFRTDIFSLGIVMYEMATGRLPFSGKTPIEAVTSILRDDPLPMPDEIPGPLARIIERSLLKDPAERYQTAGELRESLLSLRSGFEAGQIEDPTEILRQSPPKDGSDHSSETKSTAARTRIPKGLLLSGFGLLAAVLAAFAFYYFFLAAGSSLKVDSVAVIPFRNETGDHDVEYLADGLAESLVGNLSRIPDLSVKASSSAFFFKGKQASAKEIGQKLEVDAVVLGRLVKREDILKLTLELVDSKTEDVLWTDQFTRQMSDLPTLQREITMQVTDRLRSTLTGKQQEQVLKASTSNAQAYDAYLRGRFHWNERTETGFERAAEFFRRAIEIDPEYALAWSGLADTYVLIPEYGVVSQTETLPKARSAALKALELDPELAEAHSSMAYIFHAWEWKFEEAEKAYKRALELNPNYATAHQWYGELLAQQKKFEEAELEGRKAIELDPLSFIKHAAYGQTLWLAGKDDKALESFGRALELEPQIAVVHKMRCLIYISKGRNADAIRECERSYELGGEAFRFAPGVAYALTGDLERARTFIEDYDGLSARQIFDVSHIHLKLGDKEKTIEGMRLLIESRSVFPLFFPALPNLAKIRDDPEYHKLMERVGLE